MNYMDYTDDRGMHVLKWSKSRMAAIFVSGGSRALLSESNDSNLNYKKLASN
jgi:hypothetical protein